VQTTNRNCSLVSSIVSCRCATTAADTTATVPTNSTVALTTSTSDSVAMTTVIASSVSASLAPPADGSLHPGYAALIAIVVIFVVATLAGGLFVAFCRRGRRLANKDGRGDVEAARSR
jgi:hypothetical protein